MIGKVLGNRYEIVEKLGGGGMALVYKAKCSLLNREVTIKILRGEYTSDEDFVTRFRREAQAVAKLSHANIVGIYDVGHEDDIHYIVMEYIEGKNLKEYIKDQAPIPQEKAINIGKQIAEALEHAHEHQIVHRDIKPHNILITNSGRVKVTDFGIARATTTATVTQAGMVLGSVHYFSPEQAKGEVTGPKSDVYSLGVVLYEMLTGKLPFEGETPIAIALKQIQEPPLPPSDLNPNVTPDLERIVLKALAKNPEDRYQRAGLMWKDLHDLEMGSTLAGKQQYPDEFATQVLSKDALDRELARQKGEDSPRTEEKKNRNVWWLVLGVVFFGLLIGAGLAALNGFWSKEEVTVPNLTGLTVEQARIAVEEQGLQVSVIGEEFDPELERGKIVSQNPLAEAVVKEGRLIEVILSKGQEVVQVPKVTRKTLELAELDLNNADLKLGDVTEEFSDEIPTGLIIAQFPEAFSNAPKGSKVNLIISKGLEPRFIPVPNVVGKTLEEARGILQAEGLAVGETQQQPSNDVFTGIIISQDPAAGGGDNRVREGTKVNLVVSSGPGPQAKRVQINFTAIPALLQAINDGEEHEIVINVVDAKSQGNEPRVGYEDTVTYEEVLQNPNVVIEVFGSATIQVLVDDSIVQNLSV